MLWVLAVLQLVMSTEATFTLIGEIQYISGECPPPGDMWEHARAHVSGECYAFNGDELNYPGVKSITRTFVNDTHIKDLYFSEPECQSLNTSEFIPIGSCSPNEAHTRVYVLKNYCLQMETGDDVYKRPLVQLTHYSNASCSLVQQEHLLDTNVDCEPNGYNEWVILAQCNATGMYENQYSSSEEDCMAGASIEPKLFTPEEVTCVSEPAPMTYTCTDWWCRAIHKKTIIESETYLFIAAPFNCSTDADCVYPGTICNLDAPHYPICADGCRSDGEWPSTLQGATAQRTCLPTEVQNRTCLESLVWGEVVQVSGSGCTPPSNCTQDDDCVDGTICVVEEEYTTCRPGCRSDGPWPSTLTNTSVEFNCANNPSKDIRTCVNSHWEALTDNCFDDLAPALLWTVKAMMLCVGLAYLVFVTVLYSSFIHSKMPWTAALQLLALVTLGTGDTITDGVYLLTSEFSSRALRIGCVVCFITPFLSSMPYFAKLLCQCAPSSKKQTQQKSLVAGFFCFPLRFLVGLVLMIALWGSRTIAFTPMLTRLRLILNRSPLDGKEQEGENVMFSSPLFLCVVCSELILETLPQLCIQTVNAVETGQSPIAFWFSVCFGGLVLATALWKMVRGVFVLRLPCSHCFRLDRIPQSTKSDTEMI